MKLTSQAQKAFDELTALWTNPDRLIGALSVVMLQPASQRPIDRWSLRNRLLCWIAGTDDARTFKQWKQVQRRVKRGERAHYILVPCTVTITKDNPQTGDKEKRTILTGFKGIPVFAHSQTEGKPLPTLETPPPPPLADVAKRWGIELVYEASPSNRALGAYSLTGDKIKLRAKNPEIFFHELVHAADDRTHGVHGGQDPDQEAVAQIGAAVLARMYTQPIDRTTYDYVRGYQDPMRAMSKLLPRIETCILAILEVAQEIEPTPVEAPAPAAGNRTPTEPKPAYIEADADRLYAEALVHRIYIRPGMDSWTEYIEGVPIEKRRLITTKNPTAPHLDEYAASFGIDTSTVIDWLRRAVLKKDRASVAQDEQDKYREYALA